MDNTLTGTHSATVTVTTRTTYTFPDVRSLCPAHGQHLCLMCARNPSDCATSDTPSCGFYSSTGMHWDTCPNRVEGGM